ncbi:hypothetical protein GCM10027084_25940 [Pseudoxanthomonas sangjuensis]
MPNLGRTLSGMTAPTNIAFPACRGGRKGGKRGRKRAVRLADPPRANPRPVQRERGTIRINPEERRHS